MLRNYVKIAFRNLFKEPSYTLINVASLAVGIACFLFLLLLVQYTFNFDTFHEKSEQIYRLNDHILTESGSEINAAITPWPWAPAIADEFPEVEGYVRFADRSHSVAYQENILSYGVHYVDEAFFDVFSFDLQTGDPALALDGPNKVVLTPPVATSLFGQEQPVGREILLDGEPYVVSGLLEEIPAHSSIGFNMLVSSDNLTPQNYANYDNWRTHSIYTYLLLREGADIAAMESRFPAFLRSYIDEDAAERYTPSLLKYTDMFLADEYYSSQNATLDESYVYIFTAIGFLVLVISCVNFINLSTARAARRNTEVGIRKVLGAMRRQLVFQYLFEVLIIALFAVGFSMLLVEVGLPWFNSMTGWEVVVGYTSNAFFWLSCAGILLFVTLVAGGYPAFYLSRFKPSRVFQSSGTRSRKSWLRTGLVVSQFTLAVFLLVSSLTVDRQLSFLQSKDMGYQQENLIQVILPNEEARRQAELFSQELLRNPSVEQVALASNGPYSSGSVTEYRIEGTEWEEGILVSTWYADERLIPVLGLDHKLGRNFNPNLASDSAGAFIINATAARTFGWEPESSLGKTIRTGSGDDLITGEVVGVVEDFHFESLQNRISPLILRYRPAEFDNILVRTVPGAGGEGGVESTASLHGQVEELWREMFPGEPIYYFYVEEDLSDIYTTEEVIGRLLSRLTWLTMFIACLGLLGLASYSTVQRTKEIGIRKVMGATARQIATMLSKDFIRYVLVALVIGIPLAWFGVRQWLQNFAYHTSVGVDTLLITLVASLGIALATVSWQAVRAALANPIDSLRSE
ncbi:MAG: ABC transporter permease [Balneolaceae bacterium]|nr:ABC transporter permease [Balneolaceae bacterium]